MSAEVKTPVFCARGLVKRFDSLLATDHVDIDVAHGEIHALIGPNGAGKSTLVNLISGLLPLDAGRLTLGGRDITRLPVHQRVNAGLSRCFQVTSLFKDTSTLDNLRLAVASGSRPSEKNSGGIFSSNFNPFNKRDADAALTQAAQQLAARV